MHRSIKLVFIIFFSINCLFIAGLNNSRAAITPQDIMYKRYIEKGDSLMKLEKYEPAMQEFQRANYIYPDEEYPLLKMQVIESIIGTKRMQELKEATIAEQNAEKNQEQNSQTTTGITSTSTQDTKPGTTSSTGKQTSSEQNSKKIETSKALIAQYEDSLAKLDDVKDRLQKSLLYAELAEKLNENKDFALSLEYYKKSLMVESETGNEKAASDIYSGIAEVYLDSGLYKSSLDNYSKSLDLKEKSGDKQGASNILSSIGNVYKNTYFYDDAINYYEKSAQLKNTLNDKDGLSTILDNIGNIYFEQEILDKSIESYEKSAELNKELNKQDELGSSYNKIGVAYYKKGDYINAEDYLNKSLQIEKQAGNNKDVSITYNNLGNLNFDQSKYNKAADFYQKSLEIKQQENYTYGEVVTLHNLGNVYRKMDMYDKAIESFEKSRELAADNGYDDMVGKNVKVLASLYNLTNNREKAKVYDELVATKNLSGIDIDDQVSESQVSLGDETKTRRSIIEMLAEEVQKQKMLAQSEAQQREKENKINSLKIRNQQEKLKRQQAFMYSLILVIGLVLTVLFLIYRSMVQKKKANVELTEKNNLISKQKKLITDNIESASIIQKAALPTDEFFNQELPENFILNMPRDIVSGDFYWLEKYDNKVFLAVADCTGHGVQGAVVSMLGVALLNEIVYKSHKKDSGEILNQLSDKVKGLLHQNSEDDLTKIREGMDIVIIKLDKETMELEFSGANNKMYIVRKNEVLEYKGDKAPIGYYSKEHKFSTQIIKLKKGDSIYMFSDGYIDQLGGEDHRKFLSKRFQNLLVEINDIPIQQRKDILVNQHNNWRADYVQVDDILIVGIQV